MVGLGRRAGYSAQQAMDDAMALPANKTLTLGFNSKKEAKNFRLRMLSARRIARKASRSLLAPSEPGWNKTPWDDIGTLIEVNPDGTATMTVKRGGVKDPGAPKQVVIKDE